MEETVEWKERTRKAREAPRNRDPVQGQGYVDVGYNAFWLDRAEKITGTFRTSLVVDPPVGRIPATDVLGQAPFRGTPCPVGGRASRPGRQDSARALHHGLQLRPPMNPGAYNNFVEIFQTPTHVALLNEMVNDLRIIPLEGTDHVPKNVRLWKGDSHGRWEGDTLVVTTKNFTKHTNFCGSGPSMVLVKLFTRNSENSLIYKYTVNDLELFEKPCSVSAEMKKSSDPLLKDACREGSRAMSLMLSGARAQEQKGKITDDWLATCYGGSKAVKAAEERLKDEAEGTEGEQ